MTDTFLALLLAHLLADYVLQSRKMVDRKREPLILLAHGGIVFALTLAALGGAAWLAGLLALAHVGIDAIKVFALPDRLWVYLADQGAHLATLGAAALLVPEALGWELTEVARTAAILFAGFVLATLAGGPAVGLLMQDHKADLAAEGLDNAGRTIGLLERGLIYLLVLIGQPAGIGFLIAAKSILRFDTASQDQKASEYVIIGTLASFGWALLASYLTLAALELP